MQECVTENEIVAEMQRLQAEIDEDMKRLASIRKEYHQAEQCLQNWQDRFALSDDRASCGNFAADQQQFFVAPIGTVSTAGEDGRDLRVVLYDGFKGACTNMETWAKVWLIGFTEEETKSAPTSDTGHGLLSQSSNMVSGEVYLIRLPNLTFNYATPYNNSVHIANSLIANYAASSGGHVGDQDPFTLGTSPHLPEYLAAAGAASTRLRFINVLADIVGVEHETLQLRVDAPVPTDFILLDLKVYHPYIEGLTNIEKHLSVK